MMVAACLVAGSLAVVGWTRTSLHAQAQTPAAQEWSLWENYKRGFFDASGRIVDHDAEARTTSEAQAYGMFFALVANDRATFDKLLRWTTDNLADGNLETTQPAWLWGQNKQGQWQVLDRNSASDADLWLAYSLLAAGRVWQEPNYTHLGTALAQRVAATCVVRVPGVGLVLLPAPVGFRRDDEVELNPSYQPLFLLRGLSVALPEGPWAELASTTPSLVRHAAPHGFALDWVRYSAKRGWEPGLGPQAEPRASFDAIRVYLWAGMTDAATPGRKETLSALHGMRSYMKSNFYPPMIVAVDGKVTSATGPAGFSAALLPFLQAEGAAHALALQSSRLEIARSPRSGLYGEPPHYYDQNLALFGCGWQDRQFGFAADGTLQLRWRNKK